MFLLPHLVEPASSTGTQKQNRQTNSVSPYLPGNMFLGDPGTFLRSLSYGRETFNAPSQPKEIPRRLPS